MNKIDQLISIVIVPQGLGYVATLRFKDPKLDRSMSRNSHESIYESVDKYILE